MGSKIKSYRKNLKDYSLITFSPFFEDEKKKINGCVEESGKIGLSVGRPK